MPIGISFGMEFGASGGGVPFTLNATESFSIDPFERTQDLPYTWDPETQWGSGRVDTPNIIGTPTVLTGGTSGITWSIPDNVQTKGIAIDSATGELSVWFDQLMLDQCIGDTRTFVVTATRGSVVRTTTVTVTFDLSYYGLDWDVPGIDTVLNMDSDSLTQLTVLNVPANWSLQQENYRGYRSGVIQTDNKVWTLYPTADSLTLDGYDLTNIDGSRGCIIYNPSNKTNITLQNIRIDGSGYGLVPKTTGNDNSGSYDPSANGGLGGYVGDGVEDQFTMVIIDTGTADNTWIIQDSDILCKGRTYHWKLNGLQLRANTILRRCRITEAANDCLNGSGGTVEDCYLSTANTNTYNAQNTQIDIPAGLGSVGRASQGNWWGHSDCIQEFSVTGPVVVQRNYADCRFWHVCPITGEKLAGATGPYFMEGPWVSGVDQLYPMTVDRCIGRGGTANIQAPNRISTGSGTLNCSSASATATRSNTASTYVAGVRFQFPTHVGVRKVVQTTSGSGSGSVTFTTTVGFTDATATFNFGAYADSLTKYTNCWFDCTGNIYSKGEYTNNRPQLQLSNNRHLQPWVFDGSTSYAKGDPVGIIPELNPPIIAPTFTFTTVGASYVKVSFTRQNNTSYKMRHRTTAGPGAWSSWTDLSTTNIYAPGSGLTDATDYDFEIYGYNSTCKADDGSTLLVSDGPAASNSTTTAASPSLNAATSAYASQSATDGATMSNFRQEMVDQLVVALRADYGAGADELWNLFDVFYILTEGNITSLINLRDTTKYKCTITGSGTFYIADATFKTGYYAANNTGNFLNSTYKFHFTGTNVAKQNDQHLGVYNVKTGASSINGRLAGGPATALTARNSSGFWQGRGVTSSATDTGTASNSASTQGHVYLTRNNSSNFDAYFGTFGNAHVHQNGGTAFTRTSQTPWDQVMYIGGQNTGTSGAATNGFSSNETIGVVHAGKAITTTQAANIKTAIETFLTSSGFL